MKVFIFLVICLLILTGCSASQDRITNQVGLIDVNSPGSVMSMEKIKEVVQQEAQKIYQEKIKQGADLSNGPCLSDAIFPDWVADIAHDPRLPVDDESQNQCPSFRAGRAHHFIELDPKGQVIQIK